MLDKLKNRWKVNSIFQVVIILLVFALTGTTVMLLKKPVLNALFPAGDHPLWFSIMYYILILPIYNIVLLIYGALLGQFSFFWNFEKRFINRILRRNNANKVNDAV